MASTEEQLAQVEMSIEQAQHSVDKKKALETLQRNPEFQKVIMDGYFKEEAYRLVWLKADPGMQGKNEQEEVAKMIEAVAWFRQYLSNIHRIGHMAERALKDHQQTREEILAEAS